MDKLITSYFPSVPKGKKKAAATTRKKRPSSTFEEPADPDWTPPTTTKRSKVSKEVSPAKDVTPKAKGTTRKKTPISRLIQTPGASSSKIKPPANLKVIEVSSDDEQDAANCLNPSTSQTKLNPLSPYASPLPPSSIPSSTLRMTRSSRQESIVPPTPEHERREIIAASSPIVAPIRLRGLTQTWSDETVGSSQSQEDEDLDEYGGPSFSNAFSLGNRSPFATPRKDKGRAVEDSENEVFAIVSPSKTFVKSSQSQYLSMSQASPQLLKAKATVLLMEEESLDLVPTSQSQEKEYDLYGELSQRTGWYIGSQIETADVLRTPQRTQSPLKKELSLTKELPVRQLSLREDDDPGPLADDTEMHEAEEGPTIIPTDGDSQTYESPATSQTYESPVQSQRPTTFSPFASQRSPLATRLFPSTPTRSQRPPDPVTPTPALTSPGSSQATELSYCSPTQNSTQDPEEEQQEHYSIPSEVKEFQEMFRGDESYPDDFPMSLRI